MMETVALFISICYAPWFLGFSSLTWLPKLPQMTCLPSSLPSTSGIITQGSDRLCLPAFSAIAEHLVLLALANDDIELELKSKSLDKLLDSEVPDQFKRGKPDLPVVLMSTAMSDLVGPQSWLLLKLAAVPKGEV